MSNKIVNTSKAPQAVGPYSQAIFGKDLIFFSGQVALTADNQMIKGSVTAQSQQIFKNIQAILDEVGKTKKDIIKTLVFMTNMDEFAELNAVYSDFFEDHKPARSCVGVASLPLGATVEIEVIVQA